MIDGKLTITLRCKDCEGHGVRAVHPYCMVCNALVDEEDLRGSTKTLKCGHSSAHILDYNTCSECEGSGFLQRGIALEDLKSELLEELKRKLGIE